MLSILKPLFCFFFNELSHLPYYADPQNDFKRYDLEQNVYGRSMVGQCASLTLACKHHQVSNFDYFDCEKKITVLST